MTIEEYNERVVFQQMLDERFPRGAYASFVLDDESNGRYIPEGVNMTVGRVFCSEAEIIDGLWVHTIILDPTTLADEHQNYLQVQVWQVTESEDVDYLYEAETYSPDIEMQEVVRLYARPAGPRRVKPGQREVLTERHESALFPNGIEEQRGIADANDSG